MTTSKKQISISTNLSNGDIIYNYDDFKQSIICRYTNSNYDTLINPVFTTFIDDININNYQTSIIDINNYYSKYAFNVIYNLNKDLKRFDDLIFNNCSTLSSVSNIPLTFTSIGKYAFSGCNSLRYINLSDNINEIKEFAFNGTNNLKSLYIPNVTKLHNYSLSGCGIESIELNSEIDTLYHYLFKDCKNLKSFKNNNIVKVGEGVFCGCTNLEYVELSNFSQIYTEENEYTETIEEIIEVEDPFIGAIYKFYFFNAAGNLDKGIGEVEVIENISEDDFLSRLIRFVITSHDEDGTLVSKTYYVLKDALLDESGLEKYQLYDEDGVAVNLSVMLYKEDVEPVVIPVSRWRLFDSNDNEIGFIDEELANAIKAYDEAHGNTIIDTMDNGDGTEIIQILHEIEYVEYYQDGITPTGKVFDSPTDFKSQDETQYIDKYKYYSIADGSQTITLTDDLNVNACFNENYTKLYAKLNGFPVYDANQEYIVYYIYEPFLSLRKQFDTNLVLMDEENINVYVDNGFYIKYEGLVQKYPVYNINYCFLGRLNNGEWLAYTNQVELDTFASKLEGHVILDEDGNPTELLYFMMPTSYNLSREDLEEGNIENTIAKIKEIIGEIIEYQTGVNPFDEDFEEDSGDAEEPGEPDEPTEPTEPEEPETPSEEEEILPEYNNFSLLDLTYNHAKYELPNMLFASCVKLHNNNIIRKGNYNSIHSHVEITFYKTKDKSGYYSGKWDDIIGFVYYTPSTALYSYNFKWKYLTVLNKKYIHIVLNEKNYYITEEYNVDKGSYSRKFVDNIYGSPEIIDDFETSNLVTNESIFNTNIFNTKYVFNALPNYQLSIYDKYYLLDSISIIGNNTFMNCASLESIRSSFETIGDYAFKDCINLKSIPLNKCTSIGKFAFQNCISLQEITLNYLTSNENKGIFYNCSSLKKVNNLGLTTISDYLFKNCGALENINMNNITEVGKEAFYGCANINISSVNNSIKNIVKFGDYAFFGCSNITSIAFNQNITSLGKGVFKNCSGLESVTLPACIHNFTEELFACCKNLKSIIFTSPITDEIVLSGIDFCNNIESIHIPSGGRYTTPNDNCIFDTESRTIVYVCKNITKFDIDSNFITANNTLGKSIYISPNAFNNCKLSIIELDKNINTLDVTASTFNGIKNRTYHILIDKKNDPKYDLYCEIVGISHLYFK